MQIDLSTLILTIINFGVLMVLLHHVLFKPVLKHMAARQARIEEGLRAGQESATRLEEARVQLEENEKALRADLQTEAEELMRQAAVDARRQKEEGDADIRRRRDDALIALQDVQQTLKQELSRELPNVIDQLGERIDPKPSAGA